MVHLWHRAAAAVQWGLPAATGTGIAGIVIFSQRSLPLLLVLVGAVLVVSVGGIGSRLISWYGSLAGLRGYIAGLIAAVIILYGSEAVLFVTAPDTWLPPDGIVKGMHYTWGHLIYENSLGFRERDFAQPKPPGMYRIMIVGDSLSWGVGVEPDERYSYALEQLLHNRFPDRLLEVLNFARPAATTAEEVALLQSLLPVVEPDLVVVAFQEDDADLIHSVPVDAEQRQFTAWYDARIGRVAEQLRLPHVSSLGLGALEHLGRQVGWLPTRAEELRRLSRERQATLPELRRLLARSAADVHRASLPAPIFVVLPLGVYTDRPTDFVHPPKELQPTLAWQATAAETAREAGWRTVDMLPAAARELSSMPLTVNQLDRHPSPALHRLYAQFLYETIVSEYGEHITRSE
ncbi:MAG: hypothetical protein COT71_01780 [Candidatus Andersenbacteria bacterium CG10_big_fil_rev_8_21_14_0_10_54_11]|uniref:SGNH hydrolase-type esterase domain-containing protein n=1 Tax=Candidatus Andersenbacteria bacterium CG10_big_fil_rev_8_21_14_0_10_54_11 TaxID=1974485 RepID=A0A2M6WZR8_9BACT|nr:MAG: hypothetical protein COT71_01780 [Candidatus Andersenbacteria bacterium CG10_big_fil_rev_8_21_14_0_10_54_11]